MKKEYLKPDAEYINFYSEEEITSISLEDGIALTGNEVEPGGNVSGEMGVTPNPFGK